MAADVRRLWLFSRRGSQSQQIQTSFRQSFEDKPAPSPVAILLRKHATICEERIRTPRTLRSFVARFNHFPLITIMKRLGSILLFLSLLPAIISGQTNTQSIPLASGWNLIAFQVVPTDAAPASVFGLLSNDFIAAWTVDNATKQWTRYARLGTAEATNNQVAAMDPVSVGRAYWVFMNPGGTLNITGSVPALTPSITLSNGWNAVGIPTGTGQMPETVNMAAVLAASGANYEVILRWELTQYRKYSDNDLAQTNTFVLFDPNKGYWINIRSNVFTLQPKLLSTVRPDSDVEPQRPPPGNYPGPEDLKLSDSDTPLDSSAQTHIVFLPGEESQTLSIANTGGGILLWNLSWVPTDATNSNWLTLSANRGVTTVESDIITLGLDRKNLTKGTYRGVLTLQTSAGNRVFQVVAHVPDLSGEWHGSASIVTVNGRKNPVPDIDLYLSFYEDPAVPGLIRGSIDSLNSVLWPVDVPLVGHVQSSHGNILSLAGGYVLPPGDQNNPPYDLFQPLAGDIDWNVNGTLDDLNPFAFPIYRTVALLGELTTASLRDGFEIKGDYIELVYGMLREPIRMEGTFSLRRESLKPFTSRKPVLNVESTSRPSPVVLRGTNLPFGLPLTGNVSSSIRFLTDMVLLDLSVDLEIDTTTPANLTISLLAPDGQHSVRLLASANISSNTLKQISFPGTRAPVDSFANLLAAGVLTKGDWRLVITGAGGTLKSWSLRLEGQPVFDFTGKVLNGSGTSGVPAVVSLEGLPFNQTTLAGPDGTFIFRRLPGIPLNISAAALGYIPFGLGSPGLSPVYTTPTFPTNGLSPLAIAAMSRFRPMPALPFPASLTDGFSTYGASNNPVVLRLTPEPLFATNSTLFADPTVGSAPADIQFTLILPTNVVIGDQQVVWNFGDGTETNGPGLLSVAKTYSAPSPTGYVASASVTALSITASQTVTIFPSPGHTPYSNNFFQTFFTGGGTLPVNFASRITGPNDPSQPPSLVGLLMHQHADCASFDIDRAPYTTPGNRDFFSDTFTTNGLIVAGTNSVAVAQEEKINGFKEEDSNYFLDPNALPPMVWDPFPWDYAANFGYATDDSFYHPPPRIGANPNIVDSPRVRMLCNIGPQIVPPPNSEVYPADGSSIPPSAVPDPLTDLGSEGIAASRDLRMIVGPLAWSWSIINERSAP